MTNEEKIKKHYLLEKELAARIRNSSPQERKRIVSEAYRTMYEEIPWHISRNKSAEEIALESDFYLSFIMPLVQPESKILELGCGSGQLLNSLGRRVKSAWGLDTTLTKSLNTLHPNVHLVESDVASFDLGESKFDLIYSIHLIEHLHLDDVPEHLRCIQRHLTPNGKIFMVTPHAFTGPHDISKYFDDYPTGFHMKEYTYGELQTLLKEYGFINIKTQLLLRRIFKYSNSLFHIGLVNVRGIIVLEKLLSLAKSRKIQKKISNLLKLNNIYIVASKK